MNANRDTLDCPPQLAADAANLKRHFPFRICWAALNQATGETRTGADYSRRALMKSVRAGWQVWEAKA